MNLAAGGFVSPAAFPFGGNMEDEDYTPIVEKTTAIVYGEGINGITHEGVELPRSKRGGFIVATTEVGTLLAALPCLSVNIYPDDGPDTAEPEAKAKPGRKKAEPVVSAEPEAVEE